MRRIRLLLLLLLDAAVRLSAQEFVSLTAQQVRIDSVLPVYCHEFALGPSYADSTYTVSIDYPEFIDMAPADVARYQSLTAEEPAALPRVDTYLGVSRREGTLYASLVPVVKRDGRWQKLVSFRLSLHASPLSPAASRRRAAQRERRAGLYADHSVLSTGQWAKISIPSTGVYQLTESLIRQAGFTDLSRVRIYGYGGALQPQVLTSDYLASTDDLHEVPTCTVGGRRLFHGVGPVGWPSSTATTRTRNPYAREGCYFITQSADGEPLQVDSATFLASFYPTTNDYHVLHEVDDYAWYHSGRNLYESTPIPADGWHTVSLKGRAESARLTVVLTSDGAGSVDVVLNDSLLGTVSFDAIEATETLAEVSTVTFATGNLLRADNTVRLRRTSGNATQRLDYVALTFPTPAPAPDLAAGQFSAPSFVYRIMNQDHHADGPVDMVIIIPTTQKVLSQAQRLQRLHETRDSLRVRIVPSDELINEFASGTPDANAYRRYLKMLYDRAESDADMPRYLLLFGDAAWDNRMLTSSWRQYSPDDFLLSYQSDNSWSKTDSYTSDDYFCLLDDGEGTDLTLADKTDVGVGRLTARTEEEARIMVDKIESYVSNDYAGDWQNTLCFMGDDGNGNVHMAEADAAVETVMAEHDAFNIRKIYWDAYRREASSTGYRYPDVELYIRQQMQSGALVMDYCGHGAAYSLSHEQVLRIEDFAEPTTLRLPLWVTASCDIMPFDTQEENIGETAMLNPRGGAVAFFGTTRTVYTGDNRNMNCAFLKHALAMTGGKRQRLGDAVRLAKNELRYLSYEYKRINKLHYTLLGDPAMRLAAPTLSVVIDSIDGQPVGQGAVRLSAGRAVSVAGHVDSPLPFDGVVTLTVKDVATDVVCRLNDQGKDGASTPFTFSDRAVTLYNGRDSLRRGRFSQTFVVPRDISYSDSTGQMIVYAISNDRALTASGQTQAFTMGSASLTADDGIGPSIYCYLNTSAFTNGDAVNTTPYFCAQLTDKDGINAAGSSIGHDLELTVDDDPALTFNLNDYFLYDFGDYRSGTVGYSLPALSEGPHTLKFRAWDVLNNPSVAQLSFNVVRGLKPQCFSVDCTRNPATTQTSFIINHDRTGSLMDVRLEVFDTSGRLLWVKSETGVPTSSTYTLDWDLTTSSGSRLPTGVYLYRVLIGTDGSKEASQAQKLIVISTR